MRVVLLDEEDVVLIKHGIALLEEKKRRGHTGFASLDDCAPSRLPDLRRSLSTPVPSSRWRAGGVEDHHGSRYDCEREDLIGGNLSDDEVANAVFLEPCIETTTVAKDRIRWLSRKLTEAQMRSESSVDNSSRIAPG